MMKSDQTGPPGPVLAVNVRLWIGIGKGVLFGPGRAELLDAIDRCGSLRKAAQELNMSYRGAWGKIRMTEEALGFRLVENAAGNKRGYRLTKAGRELKEKFERWAAEVQGEAVEKARTVFGPSVRIESKSREATPGK